MVKMSLISRFPLILLIVAIVLPGGLNGFHYPAFTTAAATGNTFVVNSTLDTPSPDPSNSICADAQGRCTLRAAIMVANFVQGADTIILPAGEYLLTRPGLDDGALVGDLDISGDLTIQGAGSGVTTVDGNGAVTGDRVFQVLNTAQNVTLSGMTIQHGQSLTGTLGTLAGGGIYMQGTGHLVLSDVILEGNQSHNGGGLEANFSAQGGSLALDHTIVRSNTAIAGGVGAGGGVFAYLPSSTSAVTVLDSQVYSNTADGTGGGIFLDGSSLAHWQIERGQIYANSAASGGGIGNLVPLTLTDSSLHNNHAGFDGGAIEAFSPLSISHTTLEANSAGRFGGGIFDLATASGAIYHNFDNIAESTLSDNLAKYGGGIYHDGFINKNSILTLTNSTLSGNAVSLDGGGLYVYDGEAQLFNTTVAYNRVQLTFPHPLPGIGGGLYITATSVLTAENTIIAMNTRGNGIIVGTPDDCLSHGTTGTLAFDLITTTANCFVTGGQVGNIIGQDPLLGPLWYNGGFTRTHALLSGSPAINAGATLGCADASGSPLTTDQRDYIRPYGPACDIGAFEYNPNASIDFVPLLQR